MSATHPPAPAARCRNCGADLQHEVSPRFCPQCGQETALHPPTLGEFVHEFVGHYVALEGALWRSLRLLLLQPGRLTREYLEGRRRRYVLPLRLYLSASFLFFLMIKLLPSAVDEAALERAARLPADASSAQIHAAAASAAGSSPLPAIVIEQQIDCGTGGAPACNRFERFVNRVGERFRGDPRRFVEHMRSRFASSVPYAVFLMLPAFAGIVMLAYRGRRRTYGEHFVFSLHLHAFWFLALLAVALLPKDPSDLVLLAIPVYGVLALRRVYGGSWGGAIARGLLVSLLYGLLLLAATVLLVAALLSLA